MKNIEQVRANLVIPGVTDIQTKEKSMREPAKKEAGKLADAGSQKHEQPAPSNEKTQTSSTPVSPSDAADAGKQPQPPKMPKIQLNLKYKPINEILQAEHFIKHIPKIYSDHLAFDYTEKDYEIS